jgi:hypothetical protein
MRAKGSASGVGENAGKETGMTLFSYCASCGARNDQAHYSNCIANDPQVAPVDAAKAFQSRASEWCVAAFGDQMTVETSHSVKAERNHRFLEEALELVQSAGCTKAEALQLVDYVFARPVGELEQEVGGVMVCIALLCNKQGVSMDAAAEKELARIWTKVDAIRAKRAAKPEFGPLPGYAAPTPPSVACVPSTNMEP